MQNYYYLCSRKAARTGGTYTTGIEEIATDKDLNVPVYNLQGMKVNRANAKGIVIINGNRVVIK